MSISFATDKEMCKLRAVKSDWSLCYEGVGMWPFCGLEEIMYWHFFFFFDIDIFGSIYTLAFETPSPRQDLGNDQILEEKS